MTKSWQRRPSLHLEIWNTLPNRLRTTIIQTTRINLKWLTMLMSPGSSLGGARPKSSVVDENNQLWIAKFPSHHDDHDIAAWEFVAYQLAVSAGIQMTECRVDKFTSHHHTFLTKRFDRTPDSRLHFTSAMTQLGYYDSDYDASYL